jgi:FG-GAP repeat
VTESVDAVEAAGAVNVLYSSGGRLTGTGSQLFTQDTAGVGSTAEPRDDFGFALAAGDFDANGADDLAVAAPVEDVGTIADAGAVNVLYGSPSKLAGVGSQLFTQDSPAVGSTVDDSDSFGFALGANDLDSDDTDDLVIGVPSETVGTIRAAGAINILFGTSGKLTGAGSQLFTQDSAGIGSNVEPFDAFGSSFGVGSSVARCCLI